MIIEAEWSNKEIYPNMTSGKTYSLWGVGPSGVMVVDDLGVVFSAPPLDNTSFWKLVSVTATKGDVQIYP